MSATHEDSPITDIAFTPAVKAEQQRLGSRPMIERMEQGRGFAQLVTPDLAGFLAERDSFYLATASADGRPYIQHRGGPKGFLRAVDARRLAFEEFGGNRQYVSYGNLTENDRVSVFLMDYPNRRRIKIWGRSRVIERASDAAKGLDAEIWAALSPDAKRAMMINVEAWDVNCTQHITPRYDEATVAEATTRLTRRIAEQAQEIDRLRAKLVEAGLDVGPGLGAETSA